MLTNYVNMITWTGIFHSNDSSVEASSLLRPQMIISCPIGFPDSSSNKDVPSAFAVFFTGPIPSPPPISKTAGKSGSISSSSRNWFCKFKKEKKTVNNNAPAMQNKIMKQDKEKKKNNSSGFFKLYSIA